MLQQLRLIDELAAEGRIDFTFQDAMFKLRTSPSATANTLRRLRDNGLVDRIGRGTYAIRPLGALGTSTATESLPAAVGAMFRGVEHRIAYASALAELGLLTHPVRTVYVAATHQVRKQKVGRRPLRVVVERSRHIHLGAEQVGDSWISSLERALVESASRMSLAAGVEQLAEAITIGASKADPEVIHSLALEAGSRGLAAERRLASLCAAIGQPLDLAADLPHDRPLIRLDPSEEQVVWIDEKFRVAWHLAADELRSVVGS